MYVDALFELFLPKHTSLSQLQRESSEGEVEGQETIRYRFDENWYLEPSIVVDHLYAYLPASLYEDPIDAFRICGDGLGLLFQSIHSNRDQPPIDPSPFFEAILPSGSEWAIVYQAGCDRIDYLTQATIREVSFTLMHAMKNGKGFVCSSIGSR